MTDKEKIRNIIELFIAWNGETEAIDVANLDSAVDFIADSLQEEPVNKDLEKAARSYFDNICGSIGEQVRNAFKAGAKWNKANLWKSANGDDLSEIDREVIALLNDGKVIFAHRPYKGKYIETNLTTGNIKTFENKTYGDGGWNVPHVVWWLDIELPKEK